MTAAPHSDPQRPALELIDLEETALLTDEDLASNFCAFVQEHMLGADPETGEQQHWLSVGDTTYRWAGTHYEPVPEPELQRKLTDLAKSVTAEARNGTLRHPFLKPRFIKEAIEWIRICTSRGPDDINPAGAINCRNGVVRLVWDGNTPCPVLTPHNPVTDFFVEPPGLSFDPAADPAHVHTLLECLDDDGRQLFLEIASAALDVQTIRRRGHRIPAMLLIGEGQNGKDTLREVLARLHGHSSVASVSIRDWQQYDRGEGRGRFALSPLARARLSISSENSGFFKLDNLEALKAAITGDPLNVEDKGIKSCSITPRSVFLFFLNEAPLLDGGAEAILSRFAVARMPYTFSTRPKPGQRSADPRFKNDPAWVADHVLPAFLNLLIQQLGAVATHGFSLERSAAVMQELREETCHLHQFLRDEGFALDPQGSIEVGPLYVALKDWYDRNGWYDDNKNLVASVQGDEPVKASRNLVGRLKQLYPQVRAAGLHAVTRRRLISGIRPMTSEELKASRG